LADGVRFVLPRRRLGKIQYLGLIPLFFGLFFSGFAIFWMVGATGTFKGNSGPMDLLFALFGLPFLLGGLLPIGLGLAVMVGHSEVVLAGGRLRVIEKVGLWRVWSWSRPTESLQRLEVIWGGAEVNGRPVRHGPLVDLASIKAQFKDTSVKPLLMTMGYPRVALVSLANEIAKRWNQLHPDQLLGEGAAGVEVVEIEGTLARIASAVGDGDDAAAVVGATRGAAELPDQPADSKVTLEENGQGLTMTIPPAGIRKGSHGFFSFSLIWLGFMTVFTSMWVFAEISGNSKKVPWFVFLFIAGFWGIGFAMLTSAINMGKRHAIIDMVDDILLITRKNLFGVKQHEWRRGDIDTIRCGASGMEVNDVPVIELQIRPKEGKKVGLFSGRSTEELKWMAAVLRVAMDVPE
jgi:hypothetical protein